MNDRSATTSRSDDDGSSAGIRSDSDCAARASETDAEMDLLADCVLLQDPYLDSETSYALTSSAFPCFSSEMAELSDEDGETLDILGCVDDSTTMVRARTYPAKQANTIRSAVDQKARRRAQAASSACRYRSRRKVRRTRLLRVFSTDA